MWNFCVGIVGRQGQALEELQTVKTCLAISLVEQGTISTIST